MKTTQESSNPIGGLVLFLAFFMLIYIYLKWIYDLGLVKGTLVVLGILFMAFFGFDLMRGVPIDIIIERLLFDKPVYLPI